MEHYAQALCSTQALERTLCAMACAQSCRFLNSQISETEIGVIIASGVTEDQTIGTITLKVKEGVEYQNTTVSFTGIATNNGTDIINDFL